MEHDPILVLAASATARAAVKDAAAAYSEFLQLLDERQRAGLDDAAEGDEGFVLLRNAGALFIAALKASNAVDAWIYQKYPHLAPENTPDE